MRHSPRTTRLRNDRKALDELCSESTIVTYVCHTPFADYPPEEYFIYFHGIGLWLPPGSHEPLVRDRHEVFIRLGETYPRTMPDLAWRTPVFHPNISSSGVVCLGGFSTHWAPSLSLAELCNMLWDMVRYANYDVESPYNRDAARWVKLQQRFAFPLDRRPLRDRRAWDEDPHRQTPVMAEAMVAGSPTDNRDDVLEVVDAEVLDSDEPDIQFL